MKSYTALRAILRSEFLVIFRNMKIKKFILGSLVLYDSCLEFQNFNS